MSYAESWGEILSRHVQFRCKICPDGIGSFADLVSGDAWEVDERGYPAFEEAPGESLVIARTATGAQLLEAAVEAGALFTTPLTLQAVSRMQPGQRKRKQLITSRIAALRATGKPWPRYRGFKLTQAAQLAHPIERLRNFLGTVRRIILKRT